MYPKAPSWFSKKLRELDPRLVVFFNPSVKKWEIAQKLKRVQNCGFWNGMKILRVVEYRSKVLHIESLGSKVFKWIRENDPRNHRTPNEMLKMFTKAASV
jgi:hypothetical protein